MKRSEINAHIRDAERFFETMHFKLPVWASWGPEKWKGKGDVEVVRNKLGWDLTDYATGDFEKVGLILFTIRNGNLAAGDPKLYAEKIMIVGEDQVCPMHFHWKKREDIINRGGGELVIELHGSNANEEFSNEPLVVHIDGLPRTVPPGGAVILAPGESICLEPGMYHRFYGQAGKGRVLTGEVSSVNDDDADNRFFEPMPRFPAIIEDEPPYRLLVNDYPAFV
jgi:D-lyxose ketol-isomerase